MNNEELVQALTQFLTASLNAVEKGATIAGADFAGNLRARKLRTQFSEKAQQ